MKRHASYSCSNIKTTLLHHNMVCNPVILHYLFGIVIYSVNYCKAYSHINYFGSVSIRFKTVLYRFETK